MPKWSHSSEILVDQTAKQPEPQKKKPHLSNNNKSNKLYLNSSFNDVLKTNNKTAIILNENCIYSDESFDSAFQGTQGNMCQILGKI